MNDPMPGSRAFPCTRARCDHHAAKATTSSGINRDTASASLRALNPMIVAAIITISSITTTVIVVIAFTACLNCSSFMFSPAPCLSRLSSCTLGEQAYGLCLLCLAHGEPVLVIAVGAFGHVIAMPGRVRWKPYRVACRIPAILRL